MSDSRKSWYARLDGVEHGPLASHDLKELVRLGEVTPASEVRFGDDGEWVSARKVKNLFPRKHPPPLPADDRKPCPLCKEDIARDAVKCKHCGEFLDGRADKVPPSIPAGVPDVESIAISQRQLIWCLLGQFAVAALVVPLWSVALSLGLLVAVFLFLLVAALQVACVFKLAVYCYGAAFGIVLGLFSLVPFFGLFVLLVINFKATSILKGHGLQVGMMGAKPAAQIP